MSLSTEIFSKRRKIYSLWRETRVIGHSQIKTLYTSLTIFPLWCHAIARTPSWIPFTCFIITFACGQKARLLVLPEKHKRFLYLFPVQRGFFDLKSAHEGNHSKHLPHKPTLLNRFSFSFSCVCSCSSCLCSSLNFSWSAFKSSCTVLHCWQLFSASLSSLSKLSLTTTHSAMSSKRREEGVGRVESMCGEGGETQSYTHDSTNITQGRYTPQLKLWSDFYRPAYLKVLPLSWARLSSTLAFSLSSFWVEASKDLMRSCKDFIWILCCWSLSFSSVLHPTSTFSRVHSIPNPWQQTHSTNLFISLSLVCFRSSLSDFKSDTISWSWREGIDSLATAPSPSPFPSPLPLWWTLGIQHLPLAQPVALRLQLAPMESSIM